MKWSKRKNSFVCALLVMALVLCSCASSTEEASTKDEAVAYSELTKEDFETISYVNQNSDMVFELMGEMQGISDPMEGPHEEWSDDVECGGAYVLAKYDYLISSVDGIAFELGDTDSDYDWNEKEAPIEWIFVYQKRG